MFRFLALLPLLILPLRSAPTSTPHLSLPSGAVLVSSLALKGSAGGVAVIYRTHADFVGVETDSSGSYRLTWSQKLTGRATRIKASPHAGIFFVVSTGDSPSRTCLGAFAVSGSNVKSALSGASSAIQCGDRGVSMGRNRLIVARSDPAHKGSVPYRIQTSYVWSAGRFRLASMSRVPDYPANRYPIPNGTVATRTGDLILIKLEIASTETQRELGLMNRKSLDPDGGMVFVWTAPTQESFWMKNTYIPLSIAFLDSSGKILEMDDMAPLSETLHTPSVSYTYAIEVNQGFLKSNGIQMGDMVQLHLH